MSAIHVVDTGLFVALGRPSNRHFRAVRAFVTRNDLASVLPDRVYDELTVDDPDADAPAVDSTLDEGWALLWLLPNDVRRR